MSVTVLKLCSRCAHGVSADLACGGRAAKRSAAGGWTPRLCASGGVTGIGRQGQGSCRHRGVRATVWAGLGVDQSVMAALRLPGLPGLPGEYRTNAWPARFRPARSRAMSERRTYRTFNTFRNAPYRSEIALTTQRTCAVSRPVKSRKSKRADTGTTPSALRHW